MQSLWFKRFWEKKSENCPEARVAIANQHAKDHAKEVVVKKEKPERQLFAPCGRPYNMNEPKLKFHFEDLRHEYRLDLHVYK